jgi:hypothetical protein
VSPSVQTRSNLKARFDLFDLLRTLNRVLPMTLPTACRGPSAFASVLSVDGSAWIPMYTTQPNQTNSSGKTERPPGMVRINMVYGSIDIRAVTIIGSSSGLKNKLKVSKGVRVPSGS